MELDMFVPDLSLAFEYQGQQHYADNEYFTGFTDAVQKRDKTKKELCDSVGITLVNIPYWWNGKINSLKATIHNIRPDIIDNKEGYLPISNVQNESDSKFSLSHSRDWKNNKKKFETKRDDQLIPP